MGTLPKALLSEPELYEDLEPVWAAFEDLHRSRGTLDGKQQAIAWTEIRAYLDVRGIRDEEEKAELMRLVIALDNSYLEHVRKKG